MPCLATSPSGWLPWWESLPELPTELPSELPSETTRPGPDTRLPRKAQPS